MFATWSLASLAFLSLVFPIQCLPSILKSASKGSSTTTTANQAPILTTLSPACIAAIQDGEPTPSTWQTCQTSSWLLSFVNQDPVFKNLPALIKIDGFFGAISSLANIGMTCDFGQTCQSVPIWPIAQSTAQINNVTQVQATIVLLSLSYLNDWFTAAATQLTFVPTLVQEYSSSIFDQLTPEGGSANASGIPEASVFNLLATALSAVPNPYPKSAVGAQKFMSLLFQPPQSSPNAPPIELDELGALIASEGRIYASAFNSLISRWQTLFKSGSYPKASNGVLAVLASGSWFNANLNQRLTTSEAVQQIERLTYSWMVSQSLQIFRVFLHAVVVDDPASRTVYGMPGETLVTFENYTFIVWPVIWTPSPNVTSPKGFTQFLPGQVLYNALVKDRDTKIVPDDLFSQSLFCQLQQKVTTTECDGSGLNCQLSNDKTVLTPWPTSPMNVLYSQTYGSCLFNLPIVLDMSQSNLPNYHFPDGPGNLAGIASANEECPGGGLWKDWRDPMSNGVVVFIGNQLGICQTQWS